MLRNSTGPSRGNAHAADADRYLGAAQKRRDVRTAGQSPDDPVHRSPAGPAAHAAVLRRPQGAGPAGRPGLGRRTGLAVDPQWDASRCTLALPPDHEPRRTVMDDRRGAAGMVLSTRREARLPTPAGWLRRDRRRRRKGAQRIGHCRRWRSSSSTPARAPNSARPTTSIPVAAWVTRPPCICSNATCD